MKRSINGAVFYICLFMMPVQSQQKRLVIAEIPSINVKQLAAVIGILKTFAPPKINLLMYKNGSFSLKTQKMQKKHLKTK